MLSFATWFPVSLLLFRFYHYSPDLSIGWWRWRESNPWPPACRAGALPAELHPHIHGTFNSPWKSNNKLKFRLRSRRLFVLLYFAIRSVYISDVSDLVLHRKEVIQPHLPIRLPCYDLTPIIEPTFDCCLLAVSSQASGVPNFHGLTGGVYKARERIHRGMLIRDY